MISRLILIIGICLQHVIILTGQNTMQVDSIAAEMCKTTKNLLNKTDGSRIDQVFEYHVRSIRDRFLISNIDSMMNALSLRLQNRCPAFSKLTYENYENNGDYVLHSEEILGKLANEDCSMFFDHEHFYYLETTGDTVNLEIKNGIWKDHFKDGTYSKLHFIKTSDCSFTLEFIESNNFNRANFSRPGDQFLYRVLDFKEDQYDMSVQIPGQAQYFQFVLYKP